MTSGEHSSWSAKVLMAHLPDESLKAVALVVGDDSLRMGYLLHCPGSVPSRSFRSFFVCVPWTFFDGLFSSNQALATLRVRKRSISTLSTSCVRNY